jgi:hypothetical protein
VSEHFQCDLERLKERSIHNNLARRCAITLSWDHAGLSHNEIAALFRMPGSNSVAQTIRRTKAHEQLTIGFSVKDGPARASGCSSRVLFASPLVQSF